MSSSSNSSSFKPQYLSFSISSSLNDFSSQCLSLSLSFPFNAFFSQYFPLSMFSLLNVFPSQCFPLSISSPSNLNSLNISPSQLQCLNILHSQFFPLSTSSFLIVLPSQCPLLSMCSSNIFFVSHNVFSFNIFPSQYLSPALFVPHNSVLITSSFKVLHVDGATCYVWGGRHMPTLGPCWRKIKLSLSLSHRHSGL